MQKTLYQLKEEGHELIAELEALGMRQNGHRGIYSILRRKLKVEAGKEHFSNMTREWEVQNAIDELKSMLFLRREKKKHVFFRLKPDEKVKAGIQDTLTQVFLPREERLKAMQELHKKMVYVAAGVVWVIHTPPATNR